jgi:ABC-2 type transport system permease protein
VSRRLTVNAEVVLAAMRVQALEMRGSPFVTILGIVQPAIYLAIVMSAPGRLPLRTSTQLVIGVGLTALWSATVWSAGGILRGDKIRGTLARTVSGIPSPSVVFLGKCLGATLRIAVIIAASTVAAVLLLGVPVTARQLGWLGIGFFVTLLSGTALGMLLSCLFLVARYAEAWSALLMYPVSIVSGLMIPPALIPVQVRWVSAFVSLRWAAGFLTTTAFGVPSWSALACLVGLTIGYFAVAVAAFRWIVRRAMREGTLEYT